MMAVVVMAVFGDHGLVRRHELGMETAMVEHRISELLSENSEIKRSLRILDEHPVGLQRVAARQLRQAPENSTIYLFDQ
tara:strand:- start:538 stop:774 length:237 start_codon:yes stop_codon:yes gene_type:complete